MMRFQFTPGAERALAAAADWISTSADQLHVPEVLLGLLAEPECRSALLLAEVGIDAEAVRGRFASLTVAQPPDPDRASRFSTTWLECLHAAESRLVDYPQPLVLATEHLLLGIAVTPGEVSGWLADRGLDPVALEAEVHRLAGHSVGPLPIEPADVAALEQGSLDLPGPDTLREHDQVAVHRILDAAANRAGEGLRVIEDYLRFALDDRHLTGLCKAVRHDLAAALALLPDDQRHAARDTRSDVGTDLTLPSEQSRASVLDVVRASFPRALQALRSLEEYSKTISAEAAQLFEQLRYRTYTLERAVSVTEDSRARLAEARLYVLLDGRGSVDEFRRLAAALVEAGVSVIQLRDKRLSDRELLGRARLLRELTERSQTLFVMNDRPDLAVLAGADGVHVGQDELSVKDARRIVGPRALVGVSTHSIDQARTAVVDGANYIGVGPSFPSSTKHFSSFTGLELLQAVSNEIRLPAFAIGGITTGRLGDVLSTGITRVAVSEAIVGAADPAAAARQFLAALDSARAGEAQKAAAD